jgi:hypothetical protein
MSLLLLNTRYGRVKLKQGTFLNSALDGEQTASRSGRIKNEENERGNISMDLVWSKNKSSDTLRRDAWFLWEHPLRNQSHDSYLKCNNTLLTLYSVISIKNN